MKADLLLIHPPSYLYFREEKRRFGPISDVIPSTPIFDMYPYGFLTMSFHLMKKGYRVSISNLAAKMILDESLNLQKYIESIDAGVVGIDLHWMVHSHGSIELARMIKKERPDIFIVLGGLSATIFHREILSKFDWIDAIVLGDTTEIPMERLLDSLANGKNLQDIPNLAFREGNRIRVNPISFVPNDISDYGLDYHELFKNLSSSKDPVGWLPFADFIRHPIGGIILYKGCHFNCLACGGSKYAYEKYFKRKHLALKSPRAIINEMRSISEYMDMPIFLVGDIQLMGRGRLEKLLEEIKKERLSARTIFFEFFIPPSRELIEKISSIDADIYFQISPESHIEEVRKLYGRPYGNNSLFNFVKNSIGLGIKRVDIYFLIGLPRQRVEDSETLPRFISSLLEELPEEKRNKVDFFVAPLAPFIDPGSRAFDNPESFGYIITARSLSEHMNLLENAYDWRGMLNYETLWMSRIDISRATYIASRKLTEIKRDIGILNREEAELILNRIEKGYSENALEKETVSLSDLYPSQPVPFSIMEKDSNVLISIIKNLLGLD
ncbi:MAG: TIGR04190 family B12-binding domain/radical SAM domain protein [Fervidicoccaceae archaeon]